MQKVKIKGDKIFAPLIDKWVELTSEERLKQDFVIDLVTKYKYDISQLAQDVTLHDEEKVDIAIWRNKEEKDRNEIPAIVIAIDCNAEWSKITQNDVKHKLQALSLNADFLVVKNLRETRIYFVEKGKPIEQFSDIVEFPDITAISNDASIKKFIEKNKSFSRDNFNQSLQKCHNIIRNNDKLSPESAFDEISKILFLKFEYEKEYKGEIVLSKERFKEEESLYINVNKQVNKEIDANTYINERFDAIKRRLKNDELFEENEIIKVKRTSFDQILEELQNYNLIKIDDDIKGLAFESFLSRTFRGELGQFFTPRPIVEFMVKLLDPCEGELICDPCCGSGGFLISAFNYVREKIEQDVKDVLHDILNKKLDGVTNGNIYNLSQSINKEWDKTFNKGRFFKLSHECIFGTDANPRMARTSKMNMIMHGDGHGGVHHNDGLLNVNGIFENRFDVILTNPPFGSRVDKSIKITDADKYTDENKISYYTELYGKKYLDAIKQVNDNIGESLLSLYEVGKINGLTEILFIERCLNLLKPGGRMGIVLPEGVMNNDNLHYVRTLFEGKAKIILITSIPQDVFMASGATVKPSLLFLRKFTKEESVIYEQINTSTRVEIENKYKDKLLLLNDKAKKKEKKGLTNAINEEINASVKERFDYIIPIAQVQKAGITSTGAICENELTSLLEEYTPYRIKEKLWDENTPNFKYTVKNGRLLRKLNNGDWEELC